MVENVLLVTIVGSKDTKRTCSNLHDKPSEVCKCCYYSRKQVIRQDQLPESRTVTISKDEYIPSLSSFS